MKEKTIKLTLAKAREWYKAGGDLKEVALQAFSELELAGAATSIDEAVSHFCYGYLTTADGKCIQHSVPDFRKNCFHSVELAHAANALARLTTLRYDWLRSGVEEGGFRIILDEGGIFVVKFSLLPAPFSFKDAKDAKIFLSNFFQEFNRVKPLFRPVSM